MEFRKMVTITLCTRHLFFKIHSLWALSPFKHARCKSTVVNAFDKGKSKACFCSFF